MTGAKMPSKKQKEQLGDSWVVEGDDEGQDSPDSAEYTPGREEKHSPPRHIPRKQTRAANRSPEPELVMPSLDASWADSSSRSAKAARSSRSAEKEARRRTARGAATDGSPVKRSSTKAAYNDISNQRSLPGKGSENSFQDTLNIVLEHAGSMAGWIRDVVGGALRVLKTPISYLLAIWLLFGLGVVMRTLLTNTVYASLSPVCRIPGASFLNLPFCPAYRVDTSHGPPPPVEFDQLMTVQAQFEEVLVESAGGISLPMDMKRGEASIRDLKQLVRYSQLHSK
jgi:hypothetical protein